MEFDALDNEKYIYSQESAKLIDILFDFPNQFKKAQAILEQSDLRLDKKYKDVLLVGIGNPSTVAFKLLTTAKINKLKIPVSISMSKDIPTWVSNDTLIIALSHSGDTIEVLDAVDEITEKGFDVIAITTGGRLRVKANNNEKIKLLSYAADLLPRMALGYSYVLLTGVLEMAGILSVTGISRSDNQWLKWDDVENELLSYTRKLIPEIKINNNEAKRIAINLFDRVPIIYGCNSLTGTVAYRFKIQLCTVSKILAFYNTLSEISHDEIVGWEMRHDLREKFVVIFLNDKKEQGIIRKRIELLQGIFLEKDIKYEEIEIDGANDIVKAFKGIYLADWISLYLAVLNNVNPSTITLIDKIKDRMSNING